MCMTDNAKPKGASMTEHTSLFACCAWCVEGCRTKGEADRAHCDPCDACANLDSAACATCNRYDGYAPDGEPVATSLTSGTDDAPDLTETLVNSQEHLAACYGPDWATILKGGK